MLAPFSLLFLLIALVNSQYLSYDQTAILLSLKQHWGNPPSLHWWNSTSSPCDWPHVECDSAGTAIILRLGKTNLKGTIPSAICQLKNLVSIDLQMNKLLGRIPSCLDNCSNLENLDLSDNELSGTIPSTLFQLRNLVQIDLSKNKLSGRIPACLYNCSNLEVLSLSMNVLSGTIPSAICQLKNLVSIDLQMNKLLGRIPSCLDNCSNLENLDLSDNELSGTIPSAICQLRNLKIIFLRNNNLSGHIPACLYNCSNLERLNLSMNALSGAIPGELFLMPMLRYLHINGNRLFGEIPTQTLANSPLEFLDLSNNQLSGNIVENVFRLRYSVLALVDLCSNRFFGRIPYEFVNLFWEHNCLDQSNLCSYSNTWDLPRCPSSLCSKSIFRPFVNCKNYRKVRAGKIGAGVVGFVIFCCLARKSWKKAHATIAARRNIILPLNEKDKEWEMISFQKLDFDKYGVLSGLTDENLIGNGGSGKVYRVVINETGNTVAVKSIWNDKKTDERLDKEFMAEIQTLGTIRHNNIVKLLCYISGKDTQLLVYQYFANQSLDQWLHGKKKEISSSEHCSITKLDWPMRLNIAIGVAQGLCYMHHHCSAPIIHRDIKSSNILLDSEFNAKIADFGMAKMLIRNEDPETASAVVGTFGYIAPEYAYTKRVNVKSDVYSFGVVLLELTTGRKAVRPDDHMNLAGWAQIHYRETAYVVDSLDDEIKEPSFLDQIVAVFRLGVMCTTKTPANRPSMRDCLNILQDYSSCCSSSDSMS